MTELENETVFSLDQLPTKSYEKDYDVQLDITVEMNLNQLIVARDGYTILDFISDVGGIQSLLFSGVAIFVGIWNYHYNENLLVSKLYRISSTSLTQAEVKAGK